jgi:tripartite-type tricarboxylate transporter receptor subunit TctC
MKRRAAFALMLSGLAAAGAARAQGFQSRLIRMIVGPTAGGAVDIIALGVSLQLQAGLGRPVIVENFDCDPGEAAKGNTCCRRHSPRLSA